MVIEEHPMFERFVMAWDKFAEAVRSKRQGAASQRDVDQAFAELEELREQLDA